MSILLHSKLKQIAMRVDATKYNQKHDQVTVSVAITFAGSRVALPLFGCPFLLFVG